MIEHNYHWAERVDQLNNRKKIAKLISIQNDNGDKIDGERRQENLSTKHGEDASPATHIQYHLILKQMLVFNDRSAVAHGTYFVFQHLLQNF